MQYQQHTIKIVNCTGAALSISANDTFLFELQPDESNHFMVAEYDVVKITAVAVTNGKRKGRERTRIICTKHDKEWIIKETILEQ